MQPKACILHLSDLHRSRDAAIGNVPLLESLIIDRDRYISIETPLIRKPDIIIISGDIIRGSILSTGSEIEIQQQYDQATEFLQKLVEEFLNGDKSRIIIIPGNHDVDWKYSKLCMTKLDQSRVFSGDSVKKEFLREAVNARSNLRWSWRDLSFYEISDRAMYEKRLEAFAKFYDSFYDGVRSFGSVPNLQFEIFDIPAFNLTIAAFNSCYSNDHLSFVGDINPECLGEALRKLRSFKKLGRLLMATWHHNTKGLPYETNYIDSSFLKTLIDAGVSLGFHGHQHKTEVITEVSNIIEQKAIVVFSAGTLCGGPGELPVGNNRQYNLIEIEPIENGSSLQVTLHLREKSNSSSFANPVWRKGLIDSYILGNYSFTISSPPTADITMKLLEIDKKIKESSFTEVRELLKALDSTDEYVRKYVIEYVTASEDYPFALEQFHEIRTDSEAIVFLSAIKTLGRKIDAVKFLTIAEQYQTENKIVSDLLQQLKALSK